MVIFVLTPFDKGSQRAYSYSQQQLWGVVAWEREAAELLSVEELHIDNSAVRLKWYNHSVNLLTFSRPTLANFKKTKWKQVWDGTPSTTITSKSCNHNDTEQTNKNAQSTQWRSRTAVKSSNYYVCAQASDFGHQPDWQVVKLNVVEPKISVAFECVSSAELCSIVQCFYQVEGVEYLSSAPP